MARVYVNLVGLDILDAMDRTERPTPVIQVPPPEPGTAQEIVRRRRTARLLGAVEKELQAHTATSATASANLDSARTGAAPPPAPVAVPQDAAQASLRPTGTSDAMARGTVSASNVVQVNFRRQR